jgi:hypothetical protein
VNEKEHLQTQLSEEEGKKNRGEKVEEEFIDTLKSEINLIESNLQELVNDAPWIQQAIMSATLFKKMEKIIKMHPPQ